VSTSGQFCMGIAWTVPWHLVEVKRACDEELARVQGRCGWSAFNRWSRGIWGASQKDCNMLLKGFIMAVLNCTFEILYVKVSQAGGYLSPHHHLFSMGTFLRQLRHPSQHSQMRRLVKCSAQTLENNFGQIGVITCSIFGHWFVPFKLTSGAVC
jgi:hypothetical protein